MKRNLLPIPVLLGGAALCGSLGGGASGGGAPRGAVEFEPPVRLMAGGVPIRVESPGYAAPCLVDIDGDGKKDLVVDQFNQGKMKVYRNLGNGQFAEGVWIQADGAVAEVPGVW